jgi:hypothetical protein
MKSPVVFPEASFQGLPVKEAIRALPASAGTSSSGRRSSSSASSVGGAPSSEGFPLRRSKRSQSFERAPSTASSGGGSNNSFASGSAFSPASVSGGRAGSGFSASAPVSARTKVTSHEGGRFSAPRKALALQLGQAARGFSPIHPSPPPPRVQTGSANKYPGLSSGEEMRAICPVLPPGPAAAQAPQIQLAVAPPPRVQTGSARKYPGLLSGDELRVIFNPKITVKDMMDCSSRKPKGLRELAKTSWESLHFDEEKRAVSEFARALMPFVNRAGLYSIPVSRPVQRPKLNASNRPGPLKAGVALQQVPPPVPAPQQVVQVRQDPFQLSSPRANLGGENQALAGSAPGAPQSIPPIFRACERASSRIAAQEGRCVYSVRGGSAMVLAAPLNKNSRHALKTRGFAWRAVSDDQDTEDDIDGAGPDFGSVAGSLPLRLPSPEPEGWKNSFSKMVIPPESLGLPGPLGVPRIVLQDTSIKSQVNSEEEEAVPDSEDEADGAGPIVKKPEENPEEENLVPDSVDEAVGAGLIVKKPEENPEEENLVPDSVDEAVGSGLIVKKELFLSDEEEEKVGGGPVMEQSPLSDEEENTGEGGLSVGKRARGVKSKAFSDQEEEKEIPKKRRLPEVTSVAFIRQLESIIDSIPWTGSNGSFVNQVDAVLGGSNRTLVFQGQADMFKTDGMDEDSETEYNPENPQYGVNASVVKVCPLICSLTFWFGLTFV